MRNYRNYSDEDFVTAAKNSFSIAGLLRALNLKPAGGNYLHAQKTLQRLNVNCDHWTGQGWNKNQRQKDWSQYSKGTSIKPHLILLRGHICEECGNEKWNSQKIPLELEHIDGDRTNNEIENLKLLCCNCHALTSTWKRRKSIFGKGDYVLNPMRKGKYPNDLKLCEMIWSNSIPSLVSILGVSRNAIRSYCRKRDIPTPPVGFWRKTEEERIRIKNKFTSNFLENGADNVTRTRKPKGGEA